MHVEVEDLNDNTPVFHPDQYAVSISSHARPGAELLNVLATDRDSGGFGQVRYDIVPGDVSSLFDVDSQTGERLRRRFMFWFGSALPESSGAGVNDSAPVCGQTTTYGGLSPSDGSSAQQGRCGNPEASPPRHPPV